ncbi:MAG: DUF1223 domain-containing protein [Desulfatibacillaceae bacterium]
MRKYVALIVLTVLVAVGSARAGDPTLRLRNRYYRPALVEVYTTAACPSCERTESWLHSLTKEPLLWMRFVPVAFHVIHSPEAKGADPYALVQFAARQTELVRYLGTGKPYTPMFVLDGFEDKTWHKYGSVRVEDPEKVGDFSLELDRRQATMRFVPDFDPGSETLVVHAAVMGCSMEPAETSEVPEYNFVALGLTEGRLERQEDGAYLGEMSLAPRLPYAPERLALAAWITLPDDPMPLHVVGGWVTGEAGDWL